MILYFDTSALVKLYVKEALSNELATAVDEAEAVATSLLAYVETRAAFARARRETRLSSRAYRSIVDSFVEDWSRYVVVEVTDQLVRDAGELSALRALRGYDAMHLAAALCLRDRVSSLVMFLTFDRTLAVAAKREVIQLHPLGG